MILRKILTLLLIAAVPLGLGSRALADDRGTDGEEGGRHLDIKSVSNEADEEYVTYRVETYDSYDNVDDFSFFRWYFDTNGDGRFGDLCIRLEAVGDGRLRAMLYPSCGPESWSTAEATKIDDRTLEFKFPTRDFVVGGGITPGEGFAYSVASEDMQGQTDKSPDRGSIEHSPLPEPASLFITPAPENGAGGGEGGDDGADVFAPGGESEGTGFLSRLPDVIENVPTGWLLVGIVFGVVLVFAVLRYRRRILAVDAVNDDGPAAKQWSEPPLYPVDRAEGAEDRSSASDVVPVTQPMPDEPDRPASPPQTWGWTEQDGDTLRVHTPDT